MTQTTTLSEASRSLWSCKHELTPQMAQESEGVSRRGHAEATAAISTESDEVVVLVQVETPQALNDTGRRLNLGRRVSRRRTGGRRAAASRALPSTSVPSRPPRRLEVRCHPHAGTPGSALKGVCRAGSVGYSKRGRSPRGRRVRRV